MEYARARLGMGQTKFEEHCGLTRGIINKFGVLGPSTAVLEKILRKCTDLNARWLLLGDGEMLEPSAQPAHVESSVPLTDVHGNVVIVGNWDGLTPVIEAALDKALKK